MKKLTLVIKHSYFHEILNGSKKEETREIRPTNTKRHLDLDEKGEIIDIRHYDSLVLYAGYEKNSLSLKLR